MKSQTTRLKTVALPAEHGGWALVLEPIALGLLLTPTIRGLCIGLAALSCFLARHPLKLALSDRTRGRKLPRTSLADRVALIYGTTALALFTLAIIGGRKDFLLPFLLALPLVVVQVTYDAFGRSRTLLPELAGAIGVGSIATAITLSAGWPTPVAFALWVIVAGRNVPTILYLRTRLNARRRKQRSTTTAIVITAQVAAVVIIALLASWKLVPVLAVVAFVVLAIRACIGLFKLQPGATPKKLGVAEFAFGAFTVVIVTLGYGLGW